MTQETKLGQIGNMRYKCFFHFFNYRRMYPVLGVLMGSIIILVIPFTIADAVTNELGVQYALHTIFLFFLVIALILLIVAGNSFRTSLN